MRHPPFLKFVLFVGAMAFSLGVGAQIASVSVRGISNNKVLLSVNGEFPKFVEQGQSHMGVRVLSVQGGRVSLRQGGEQFELQVGQTRANSEGHVPDMQGASANSYTLSEKTKIALQQAQNPEVNEELKLVVTSKRNGHFYLPGKINGKAVDFLVDTGASNISLTERNAEQLGVHFERNERVSAQTAAGVVRGFRTHLNEVVLAQGEFFVLNNVPAFIIETNTSFKQPDNQPLLLGMSVLSQFKLSVDKEKLILEKNPPTPAKK